MPKHRHSPVQSLYELLSSMRFAISLLSVLAIASIIGTVLQQHKPYSDYEFEFGRFWFAAFGKLGLYDVYHAWWFIVILLFLVLSTSLCIYRNLPLMLREMRSFREHATETSLRHFAHKAEWHVARPVSVALLTEYLARRGYRYKTNPRGEGRVLIAAKKGSYRRLGYIFAHLAIVVICLGGLIDGNIPLKVEEVLGIKAIENNNIPVNQVPEKSRLSSANLSFRGNVVIPEGQGVDFIFISQGSGYLVQELPFSIKLIKFFIKHYPTGQPRTFASTVEITDKATGRSFTHTITVNHPLIYRGVAIYQASFQDGGSHLTFQGWNLFSPEPKPFPFHGAVNQDAELSNGNMKYSVEFTDFRLFNVENLGGGSAAAAVAKPQGFWSAVKGMFGDGLDKEKSKDSHNIGPSVHFKLRNAQGQAVEYDNYLAPVQINGRSFFLSGERASPAQPFSYIRFPVDENQSIGGYMRLRAMLINSAKWHEIAERFARHALQGQSIAPEMEKKFVSSTERVLQIFARGGYDTLARFIEKSVPAKDREKAVRTYLKVLENAAFEAYQLSRAGAGLPPAKVDRRSVQFVRDSLTAFSDSFFYGSPVYLQLTRFKQVQATGLQMTRSPGKNVVFSGSLLLVLGVFFMFYIRERRIWLLVKPDGGDIFFAMSSNRKALDFEREFEQHRYHLAELIKE